MTGSAWWMQLTPAWKKAFGETFFQHTQVPAERELQDLYHAPVLRFAGPSAPYPNMSFELTDLTGLQTLVHLEILVVSHHLIESVRLVGKLTTLKSLFVFNNRLKSLDGVEHLVHLEQLYAQYNHIESIAPLRQLTKLKVLYINDNNIASLEGLTEEHAYHLQMLFCKPNELLKQKEITRVEGDLGIRCRNL